MNAQAYERLRERLEEAKTAESRALGALQVSRKTLKEKFGCSTIAEARKKLEAMRTRLRKLEDRLDGDMIKFERKWRTRLKDC